MSTQQIAERIEHLPPASRKLAENYVEFLSEQTESDVELPTFSWAGSLEELKDDYSAVELQKKASDWM